MERISVRPLRRVARALAAGPQAYVQACNAIVEQLESRVFLAANPIVLENERPGTPEIEWRISRDGDKTLQGFATDISVDQGQTVYFKIDDKDRAPYRLDIYRMGYYQGHGARRVATFYSSPNLQIAQPAGLSDPTTGLLDCGNWSVTDSWRVPATATSGIYFAKITRLDTGGASHVYFIVRDDDGHSDMLFQTSDTTWHAYNAYGGKSLYDHQSPGGKAAKVSYNRPFIDRDTDGVNSFVFTSEYPMVRWLERNGYNVSYFTGVDAARYGKEILEHKVFMSVGHDEYWSGEMRTNVEAALGAGVNLAFFSGNEGFQKVRWEQSIDASGTPYRTLVCYKESEVPSKRDPLPNVWTGTWRDPRFASTTDGGRPENALTGTIFMVNSMRSDPIYVPAEDGTLRFWRNTSIANLAPGETATLPAGMLGYEWDVDMDNGFRPAGLINMSHTTLDVHRLLVNDNAVWGSYAPGRATHSLTMYRAPSGALVFGAGTVQWSWGLDREHDRYGAMDDIRMKQATVNLFADMGIQPQTLQPDLVRATASTDTLAPRSVITWSPEGQNLKPGDVITITGTASDSGGGVVAGIEVSVDGGLSWHEAEGRSNWQYTWQVNAAGDIRILSRATDDSLRTETPGAGVGVWVAGTTPTSVWNDRTLPFATPSTDSRVATAGGVELGMKFRTSAAGQVLGVRFYKFYQNIGVHTGNLWSSTGQLLATVTFANESEFGWQRAYFSNPVSIQAGQTYIISYHSTTAYYAQDRSYFGPSGVTNGPVTALRSGVDGPNGVYAYGSSNVFPSSSYSSTNYYVDVLFAPIPDTTAPAVTGYGPAAGATGIALGTNITVSFSEAINATSAVLEVRDGTGTVVRGTISYDMATQTLILQPAIFLAGETTYTVTLSNVADLAGNPLGAPLSWSFTTAAATMDTVTIWSSAAGPSGPAAADSLTIQAGGVELGTKFRSDAGGQVLGVRFYKGSANLGTHTGSLWTGKGQLLATVTFASETASGWQQAYFNAPVTILPGQTYIISYHTTSDRWVCDRNYFATAGVDSGNLHALRSGVDGANGVYAYGTGGIFPSGSYSSSNYWVDVLFTPIPDTTAPTIKTQSPAPGATDVAINTEVSVSFSEAINATSAVLGMHDGSGTTVRGTISYNTATQTLTFRPSIMLAGLSTYTVMLSGVTDLAGNPLGAPVSWSFTTTTATVGTSSIWSSAAGPSGPGEADAMTLQAGGVELGTKFRSDVGGRVLGVRFYKGSVNTGVHTGSLWSSTGQRLATATFAEETASGWQEVYFDAPVTILPGQTYIASYHTSTDHWVADRYYFAAAGVDSGDLHALRSGVDGANGVHAYGSGGIFPAASYSSSNYWVDVLFTSVPDTTAPTLVAQTPAADATDVMVNSLISVSFSEAINATSALLSVQDGAGTTVQGTLGYDTTTHTLIFQPSTLLAGQTIYTVTLSGVTDLAGNPLASPLTWSFTTAAAG